MRITRRLLVLPLALLSLQLAGCGTLITLIDGPKDFDENPIAHVYSGTRLTLGGVRKSPVGFIFLIDLPFSFAGDTLLLPIRALQDVYTRFFGAEEKPEAEIQPEST